MKTKTLEVLFHETLKDISLSWVATPHSSSSPQNTG